MSSTTEAFCPGFTWVRSVSFMLASTQGRVFDTSTNSGVAALTCSPGCNFTLTAVPPIGALIVVRSRSSLARSRSAFFSRTSGCSSVGISGSPPSAASMRASRLLTIADPVARADRRVLRLVELGDRGVAVGGERALPRRLPHQIFGAVFRLAQLVLGLAATARARSRHRCGPCRVRPRPCRAPAGTARDRV